MGIFNESDLDNQKVSMKKLNIIRLEKPNKQPQETPFAKQEKDIQQPVKVPIQEVPKAPVVDDIADLWRTIEEEKAKPVSTSPIVKQEEEEQQPVKVPNQEVPKAPVVDEVTDLWKTIEEEKTKLVSTSPIVKQEEEEQQPVKVPNQEVPKAPVVDEVTDLWKTIEEEKTKPVSTSPIVKQEEQQPVKVPIQEVPKAPVVDEVTDLWKTIEEENAKPVSTGPFAKQEVEDQQQIETEEVPALFVEEEIDISHDVPKKKRKFFSKKITVKKEKVKKEKEEKEDQKITRKKKRPQAKKSIADILPVIDITELGYIELKEDYGYCEILQIQSKDVYAMNEEETRIDIYGLASFFQAYHHDIKFIALNFPVSTIKQQEFIQKKIDNCQNELYEKVLLRKLKELQFLEWGRTNREYAICIYGATEKEVHERVATVTRLLRRSAPLSPMDSEKKIEILYKLYNQNSKIGTQK
ncbi:hypothetical protein [Bacillus sp. 37MA]|uniref:hypothetical protein n=1 Tax=Bacillus sp. 37MA TaxID=1132442 RepID=UPI000378DFB1|nr:hypothetical protein [Bacillus sp. 37MA]